MSFSNSLREQTDRIDSCAFCRNDPLMADKGGSRRNTATGVDVRAEDRTGAPSEFDPLVTALGGGQLDFEAMLAIADILPVMVAYLDRSLRYGFVNKPYARWFERARSELLGRPVSEVIGTEALEARHPMLAAALAGER